MGAVGDGDSGRRDGKRKRLGGGGRDNRKGIERVGGILRVPGFVAKFGSEWDRGLGVVEVSLLELVASTSTAVGLELQLTGCTGVDVQGSTQLARLGSDRGTWLAGKGGVGRHKSEVHRLWAAQPGPSPQWWDCPSITQGCLPARLTDPDDESVPYIPPISILCDRF